MKLEFPGSRPGGFACLIGTLTCIATLAAQPAPSSSAQPSPSPSANPNRSNSTAGTTGDETEWRFVSNLTLQATYDDNITIRPTNEIDDYVFHVAPSLAFGIGNFRTATAPYAPIPHFLARTGEEYLPRRDYAFASYTPDAVFFREHDDENAVNHDVRMAARKERDTWNAHGELRFQRITDADLDFGRRLRQTYYTAHAAGERALSGKVSGGLGARIYRAEYAGGDESTDFRGNGHFNHQIAPKTRLGAGVAAGYLLVGNGADQTYQQPFVQVLYQPTAKISLNGQLGHEFRQYDSSVEDRSRFVFAFTTNYEAREATSFNVSARRETQSSAQYSGENIVATFYQGGVRQRFFQRMYLSLHGGFVRNQYETNAPVTFLGRRDDFTFYRASSSLDVTRRGTLELSYEKRDNASTIRTFDFNQQLVSLRASFLF